MADPCYSKRYRDALEMSAKLHRHQRRKGTDVPYLAHLLHVSAMVWEAGGDEDQAIAALLHDAVEDHGGSTTLEKIRKRFGKRVARIVWDCSDSDGPKRKAPWVERKTRHVEALAGARDDCLVVIAADKVHNVESLVAELQSSGRAVWSRFNAPPESLVWYYQRVWSLLAERLGIDHGLVRRLDRGVGLLAVWAAVSRDAARPLAA
jgi:(p)ppGpp synthase/HD superfamily hydrolase